MERTASSRVLGAALALFGALGCGGAAAPARTDTTTTTWSFSPDAAGAATAAPAGAAPASPAPASSALFVHVGADPHGVIAASVWRVSGDGRASRVRYAFPPVGSMSILGGTAPIASRDGRRIAFVKDRGVWLLDLTTMQARALGPPAPPGQEALVCAWSKDGDDVLAYFGDPRAALPSDDTPTLYRLVSAAAGGAVDVPLPGEFVGWLPDGEAVARSRDGRVLRRVQPGTSGDRAAAELYRSPAYLVQVALSPDGRSMVAATRAGNVDRVVRVDLASSAVTTLAESTQGRGVQNPWPEFSPSGAKIAWMEEPPLAVNEEAERVAVAAGAARTALDAGGARIRAFHWIDDGSIAIESEGRLLVVDVATGAVKGRTPLE